MRQALLIGSTVLAFRQTGKHIALAAAEYGGIAGLVTLNDAMEAIVGDFPSQDERLKPAAKKREDSSWLIDAMIEIDDLIRWTPAFKPGRANGALLSPDRGEASGGVAGVQTLTGSAAAWDWWI
jgi:hypothetical protein